MRLLALLLVPFLALAGCTAPREPLLSDAGPDAEQPLPAAPPSAPPPASPPPAASTPANNTTAEPGSDAWDGTVFLHVDQTSTNDGPHTLVFQGPVVLDLTIALTGGASQGDIRVRVDVGPPAGCGSERVQDPETPLEGAGPSPLTLSGGLEAGSYCVWVGGAPGSIHAAADYHVEAAWTPLA